MSSSKEETINNVKKTLNNTLNNITNSETGKKVLSRLAKDKERLEIFIKNYKTPILVTTLLIFIIITYLVVFYRRIPRYLERMDTNYKKIVNIQPLQYNRKIMNGNFKLCDFYVASSYKSYLPCTNYYDYASIDAIKKCIMYGARYIDLDVMNKDFNDCSEPVICAGDEVGNWHYTTAIDFDQTIKTIAKYAFSGLIKNGSDPLFININFKVWYNKKTIDKCAASLKKYLNGKFLPQKFSYAGRYTSTNLATTSIKKLINKVIIFSTNDVSGTEMDELVNLNPNIGGNVRNMTFEKVKDSYDPKELTDFNKKNLTRVYSDFDGRKKQNNNFFTPYYLGCQFILMNYTEPDDWMNAYIKNFKNYSFILKPYKLRYHPKFIKQPLQQTKKVSFAPKKVSTPFYSITY